MIEWSDTDEAVRAMVRDFIDKEVRPHLDELETGRLAPYGILRRLFQAFGLDEMARDGLEKSLARERAVAAGTTPEPASEEGPGGDMSMMSSMGAVLMSELAGVSLGSVASMGVSLGLTAATIRKRGTLEQKERWLPRLVTLEHIGAWAITEPDSGSDAFGGMTTYVRRDGDDYVLTGRKTFITNGPDADVAVVYAKLDEGDDGSEEARRRRPVLTFVLDAGMPGFERGRGFAKMGMMSSPTGELFFDGVRLGPDRLLGGPARAGETGDAKDEVRSAFAGERIGIAVLALGIINECLRLCVDYAKSRTLWGRPIAELQLIQLKLAQMEVARMNVQNMVFATIEHGERGSTPGLAEASAMKLYSSQAATEVAMEAVQLFGGNGYMAEYRVEQLARDAKSLMIYAGSNEVQVTHVAKGLLG